MKRYKFCSLWARHYNWLLTRICPLKSRWRCFYLGEWFTDNVVIELQLKKGLGTDWQSAKTKVPLNPLHLRILWRVISCTNYQWWNWICCRNSMTLCFLFRTRPTHLKTFPSKYKIGCLNLWKSGRRKVQDLIRQFSAIWHLQKFICFNLSICKQRCSSRELWYDLQILRNHKKFSMRSLWKFTMI